MRVRLNASISLAQNQLAIASSDQWWRRANSCDLCAVRHSELPHDLSNMKFHGTLAHPEPASNDLVWAPTAQKLENSLLPHR
jgi:hypothetical protein